MIINCVIILSNKKASFTEAFFYIQKSEFYIGIQAFSFYQITAL